MGKTLKVLLVAVLAGSAHLAGASTELYQFPRASDKKVQSDLQAQDIDPFVRMIATEMKASARALQRGFEKELTYTDLIRACLVARKSSQRPETILSRKLQGETLEAIAASLSVDYAAIRKQSKPIYRKLYRELMRQDMPQAKLSPATAGVSKDSDPTVTLQTDSLETDENQP